MTQKLTLNQISNELARLWFIVDAEYQGDINSLPQEEFERLTTLGDALPQKVDNWIQYLESLDSESKVYKEREEKAKRLRKSRENALERLSDYLARMIQANPKVNYAGDLGELKVRKNPEKLEHNLPTKRWSNENIVSKEMLEERPWLEDYVEDVTVKILKTADLKDALKGGATYQAAWLTRKFRLEW